MQREVSLKSALDCTCRNQCTMRIHHTKILRDDNFLHLSTNTCTHNSWLKENRVHPDKSEVVGLGQALVADAAELIPDERREPVLCGRTVHRLCHKVSRHVEIRYLDKKAKQKIL